MATAAQTTEGGGVTVKSTNKCFGGIVKQLQHDSSSTGTPMVFSVFVPPGASASAKCPVLLWLSGLTCTDQNFITKAGAQRAAAAHGIALVCPDTSPRGAGVEGEEEDWDFGTGAGFYVDTTEAKWSKNYNMYSYVTSELPAVAAAALPELDWERVSVSGHSMGGHGALICALKNPGKYKSCSAFAPICHPSKCPWGIKALTGYMGASDAAWEDWDATCLAGVYTGEALHILIDQGADDGFLTKKQLLPEALQAACSSGSDVTVELRLQPGYDHSYYFIATFIEDHIAHAAKALGVKATAGTAASTSSPAASAGGK